MIEPIPLSLYIHLPWCVKKCPYCDFNAHPLKSDTPKSSYIQHLIEDLRSHQSLLSTRPLHSIFIGGGTPSIFSAAELKPLFNELKPYLKGDIEITMEANPGVLDHRQFPSYRALGINRLSIGGQSFDQGSLSHLGRFHTAQHTHQAIRIAKQSGFERINLDLMYGTPHQNLSQALWDLELFLSYDIEHLSWYQLNIEPNTHFAVHRPHIPHDSQIASIEHHGQGLLSQMGYKQYEISAWTKHKPSSHNVNYWHFGDYLGIGCGAHSKITCPKKEIKRLIKHKHPKAYMTTSKLQQELIISENEIMLEFAINFCRTNHYMSFDTFTNRTGLSKTYFNQKMSKAIQHSWIKLFSDGFETTKLGQLHYHDICLSL